MSVQLTDRERRYLLSHAAWAPEGDEGFLDGEILLAKIEGRDPDVDHPAHYGGEDNPYEAIKVIEAWHLGFHLGNCVKYIARAGRKAELLVDLKKARWYLDRMISQVENERGIDGDES